MEKISWTDRVRNEGVLEFVRNLVAHGDAREVN